MMIILCNLVDDRLKYLKRISSLSFSWLCEYTFALFIPVNNKGIFYAGYRWFFFHLLASVYHVSYTRSTMRKREKEKERERRDFNAYMFGV